MSKKTIVPYWFLMLQALSEDHAKEVVTWTELMARYFGLDTDIFHLMEQILHKIKIDANKQVDSLDFLLPKFTYTYQIKEEQQGFYLFINESAEKIKIANNEKSSINKGLTSLGYKKR